MDETGLPHKVTSYLLFSSVRAGDTGIMNGHEDVVSSDPEYLFRFFFVRYETMKFLRQPFQF